MSNFKLVLLLRVLFLSYLNHSNIIIDFHSKFKSFYRQDYRKKINVTMLEYKYIFRLLDGESGNREKNINCRRRKRYT